MNREQRRAAERKGALPQQQDMKVQHGWTETHVVVVFPRPVNNIQLTPEQADAFIKSIQGSLEGLKAMQAGKPIPSQLAQAPGEAANG